MIPPNDNDLPPAEPNDGTGTPGFPAGGGSGGGSTTPGGEAGGGSTAPGSESSGGSATPGSEAGSGSTAPPPFDPLDPTVDFADVADDEPVVIGRSRKRPQTFEPDLNSQQVAGGGWSVASYAERNRIPHSSRVEGITTCYIKPDRTLWRLVGGVRNLHWALEGSGAEPGAEPVFAANFTVSLSAGKTFGRYANGAVVLAAGKTAAQVIQMAAIESIYPVYGVPSLALAQSVSSLGELGASVLNDLTATFVPRDAGELTKVGILKDGKRLGEVGESSVWMQQETVVRSLVPVTYQALADYAAGRPKLVLPGNTPDDRPAEVRSANAPQAAASLTSAALSLLGIYPWFYGTSDTDTVPSVYDGTKVVAASAGTLTVPAFGQGTKWLWFAVPRTANGSRQKLFASWYRSALDNGAIGGASNLFRSPVDVLVNSKNLAANWSHDYDLYFTNYQTLAAVATNLV